MARRIELRLTAKDRLRLEGWVRASTTSQRLAMRSQIVLLLGKGLSVRAVARKLDRARQTVDLWRRRYLEGGCEALVLDRPGRGRKARVIKQ
jgi:transposase